MIIVSGHFSFFFYYVSVGVIAGEKTDEKQKCLSPCKKCVYFLVFSLPSFELQSNATQRLHGRSKWVGNCSSYTGCSVNIVFFSEDFQIFRTLAFLCFPSVSVCVHTTTGRKPVLQQNCQSLEKSQNFKEKHNI